MSPYLITFLVSILLCGCAELALRHTRAGGVFLMGAAVLPPVFLAAARDFTVGTDITLYGNYVFTYARFSSDPLAFMWKKSDIEPLYKGLAAFVSRFTDNPHWFYFATALIICGCIMGGLYFYRGFCSITLCWACFLFLFYGDTLNTMRQCLALAVVFWSFPLFLKKKYLLYALFQAVAILFHMTGCIALVFPLLYLFLRRVPMQWVQFFFVIFCMGAVMFYSPMLRAVLKTGLLPGKFYRYLAKGVAVAVNPTILRLPFLVPILVYYNRFCCFMAKEASLIPVRRDIGPAGSCPVPARGSGSSAGGAFVPGGNGERASGAASGPGGAGKTGPEPLAVKADSTPHIKIEENAGKTGPEPLVFKAGEESVPGMFFVLMLLMEICTVQLRSVIPALYRISYYFGCFRFIAYSRLARILRKDNRAFIVVMLLIYLSVLWVYQNVIQGNNEIYPYRADPGWWQLDYGLEPPVKW